MALMRERYPEAMAFVDLTNATANDARVVWFSFLAFMTFLTLAVFGTDHRDLFLGSPLALPPPISIEIDLVGFYVVGPLLLLALHVFLLVKLVLLASVYRVFEAELKIDAKLTSERAQMRNHLNTTLFVRALAAWHGEGAPPPPSAWLMTGLLFTTLTLAPISAFVFTWIDFLPYQSEAVTMAHRVFVALDAIALIISLRSVWPLRIPLQAHTVSSCGALMLLGLAWIALTFPRECWGEVEDFCWDDNVISHAISSTIGTGREIGPIQTAAPSWPMTTLSLANEDFVDDLRISDLSKVGFVHNLNDRSLVGVNLAESDLRKFALVGVDLRGANLRKSNLKQTHFTSSLMQGANLERAKMQGANLVEAKLQGASLRDAQLQGASLSRAELQGADLTDAEMQGATLVSTQMQGAILLEARMLGANLSSAQLQAADLSSAELQISSLEHAELQAAILRGANLTGADLSATKLQGADLSQAQMQSTVLVAPEIWRVAPDFLGQALLVHPLYAPVHEREILAGYWLSLIPQGHNRGLAEKRLSLISVPDAVDDLARFETWQILSQITEKLDDREIFDKQYYAYRKIILNYACSKLDYVDYAVAGIREAIENRLNWTNEQTTNLLAEIEAIQEGSDEICHKQN